MPTATRKPERLFAPGRLEVKLADGGSAVEEGIFSGHGALFNTPHPTSSWRLPPDWQDVIKPGAFKRTLGEHKKLGTLPALVLQHDILNPIGAYRSMEEDKDGLAVEGQLAIKIEDASNTYELMKIGGLRGLSIGFNPAAFSLDEKTKTRSITDVDLYEVSPVTIGAIPGALIMDVKAMSKGDAGSLVLGLHAVKAMAQDMSDECKDCQGYDPDNPDDDRCEHLAMIDRCQELIDGVGEDPEEGKSRRIDPHNIRDLEAVLRDAGLSRSEAKRLLTAGFDALAPRDASAGLAASLQQLEQTIRG